MTSKRSGQSVKSPNMHKQINVTKLIVYRPLQGGRYTVRDKLRNTVAFVSMSV